MLGLSTLYVLQARLTILRDDPSPAHDPQALALSALGWILQDDDRAGRLLALTGLTPDSLKEGLGESSILGAVLDFLCAYEPDLLAAAEALQVEPQLLAGARQELDG